MIAGFVYSDEARIQLEVVGPQGRVRDVDAVIDTGFTGALTLPPAVVQALGLRWQRLERGMLADGSDCLFDVYEANVLWDGTARRIFIGEADTDPLVGMTLLRDYELNIKVRARGEVTIRRLDEREAEG